MGDGLRPDHCSGRSGHGQLQSHVCGRHVSRGGRPSPDFGGGPASHRGQPRRRPACGDPHVSGGAGVRGGEARAARRESVSGVY
eukprot:3816133-Alexandrium_andersonii.AAC.1